MGWCSGTRAFDASIEAAIDAGVKGAKLIDFAVHVMGVLEDMDWDCHSESDYYDHPTIRLAFQQVHPGWYDDDERD